jgi:hypothetical protein
VVIAVLPVSEAAADESVVLIEPVVSEAAMLSEEAVDEVAADEVAADEVAADEADEALLPQPASENAMAQARNMDTTFFTFIVNPPLFDS